MKKILLFAVLILVLLLVWWLYPGRSRNEQVLSEVTQNSSPEALSNAVPQPEVSNRTPIIQTVPAEGVPEQKETRSATEQIYDEWKTPINFFGKVVDENNAPVANADVRFSSTDLSATGTSQRALTRLAIHLKYWMNFKFEDGRTLELKSRAIDWKFRSNSWRSCAKICLSRAAITSTAPGIWSHSNNS